MFILGLLAFLQTVFIPGFILLKYSGYNRPEKSVSYGKIQFLVFTFAFSLLINYLLVFALTAMGIYKPLTLYIILFMEGGLLIYYWIRCSQPPHCCYFTVDIPKGYNSIKNLFSSHSLRYNLLLLLSVAVILWYVFLFFYFLGGVFQHWDPVVGWNRFALDWANNRLPGDTLHYPQLLPANWSVSYVIMQNTNVQCFAKAIMPLFSIGILLLFLDLGLRKNKGVYLLGAILYGTLLSYIYNPSYIVSGYVDIGVSFFAFLSFYVIESHRRKDSALPFQIVLLAVTFAATAAITKQAGLFILVIILIFVIYKNVLQGVRKPIPGKGKPLVRALLLLLVVGIITAPWYLLKEVQIEHGKDRSEIHMVQQAHRIDDYSQRFTQSIDRLLTHRHPKLKYPLLLAGLIMLMGLFHRQSWGVTLFIVIPYILLWGFFFSYDFRNLALALPFMSFSTAHGADFLRKLLPSPVKLPVLRIPLILLIFSVFLVSVFLTLTFFNDTALRKDQVHKKMEMGDKELNSLLYDYHNKHGITGKIATNYQYLRYLPGLEPYYLFHPGRVTAKFLKSLDSAEGERIHYLLVPFILKREKETYRYFWDKVKKKDFQVIFKWRGYRFVRVK